MVSILFFSPVYFKLAFIPTSWHCFCQRHDWPPQGQNLSPVDTWSVSSSHAFHLQKFSPWSLWRHPLPVTNLCCHFLVSWGDYSRAPALTLLLDCQMPSLLICSPHCNHSVPLKTHMALPHPLLLRSLSGFAITQGTYPSSVPGFEGSGLCEIKIILSFLLLPRVSCHAGSYLRVYNE